MITQITIEQVKKSYNGRVGCMCGCNGKYSLTSPAHIQAANEECGWDAYDESSVSPRSAKIAVNKINKALAMLPSARKMEGIDLMVADDETWIAIDCGDRTTAVYL